MKSIFIFILIDAGISGVRKEEMKHENLYRAYEGHGNADRDKEGYAMVLEEFIEEWNNESNTVRVHTSGSTGKPKEMLVEKERMAASARITCSFLGLKRGDTSLLCMPLDYIAGKMMVVRSLVCGLKLIAKWSARW